MQTSCASACFGQSPGGAHGAGPSLKRAVPTGCPPSHQGRAGCAYSLTGVTFAFCNTHAVGPALMALCRELQLSKQKMPCPVLMEHIILRPKPSSRPLQLLCRSVLPIKQLANEKTLLPWGGLGGFVAVAVLCFGFLNKQSKLIWASYIRLQDEDTETVCLPSVIF